jgi:hypothetical protein
MNRLRRRLLRALSSSVVVVAVGVGLRGAQATLTWVDNADNEAGFVIQRRTLTGAYADIAIVRPNVTTYTDTGAVGGQTYLYRVRAYNTFGSSLHSRAASLTLPAELPQPAAPTLSELAALALAPGQPSAPIAFSVAVPGGAAVTVTASSSNAGLIPAGSLVLGGTAAARTLVITPVAGLTGTATITLVASTPQRSASRSFMVTVGPPGVPDPGAVAAPQGALYLASVPAVSGFVAVHRRGDGTAVLVADGAALPAAVGPMPIVLSAAGEFAVEAPGVGLIRGVVSSGSFSGVLGSGAAAFSEMRDYPAGPTGALAGTYRGVVTGDSGEAVTLLVGGSGRGVLVLPDGAWLTAVPVTLTSTGRVDGALPGGRIDLVLDGASGTFGGILPGGAAGGERTVGGQREGGSATASMTNLSVRAVSGDGGRRLVAGFTLAGGGERRLLLRAVGPTLAAFGVPGVLDDPRLTVLRVGSAAGAPPLAENDDWVAISVPAGTPAMAAFPLPGGSRDAALLASLPGGGYTVEVGGRAGASGATLFEIYDAEPPGTAAGPRLTNLSLRGELAQPGEVLISGFALQGSVPRRVMLRAIGPELALFGVPGVLTDPQVTVYTSSGAVLATNDQAAATTGPVAASVGAFPLSAATRSAVLVLWLAPGVYTAHVGGVGAGTGAVMFELYDVP